MVHWLQKSDDDDNQERHPEVQVEDLMTMVKNAEKNILLLNEVCVHSLEKLDQIRTEKETLQGEINILQMHLAEADARLKLQKSFKDLLLEGEILSLKREMAESGTTRKDILGTEEENKSLQARIGVSKSHIQDTSSIIGEIDALKEENSSYKEEKKVLRLQLANIDEKDRFIAQAEKERTSLKEYVKELESKLVIARKNISELDYVKVEREAMKKTIDHSQTDSEKSPQRIAFPDDILLTNRAFQGKIDRLKTSLEKDETDKKLLKETQEKNEFI